MARERGGKVKGERERENERREIHAFPDTNTYTGRERNKHTQA